MTVPLLLLCEDDYVMFALGVTMLPVRLHGFWNTISHQNISFLVLPLMIGILIQCGVSNTSAKPDRSLWSVSVLLWFWPDDDPCWIETK